MSPWVEKSLKSVTHGQCDARPTVTFPVAGHRCPASGTKLYCLVTEAHVCEQLAQGRYLTAARSGVELATSRVASQRLNPDTTSRDSKYCDERVCLSVCLSAGISQRPHVRSSRTLLYTCHLWPWLGPSLTTIQYAVYFRFFFHVTVNVKRQIVLL